MDPLTADRQAAPSRPVINGRDFLDSHRESTLGPLAVLLALGLAGGGRLPAADAPEPAPPLRTIVEWTFDRDGDLAGWQPNGHWKDVRVAEGALRCTAVGADPILELRAPLAFPATPWQAIEVRLRASRDGVAEVFWSNTSEGRYGGFSQEKSTRFPVTGDSQWATYRILPFWHPEGRIARLRFDLYDAAEFSLDSLRVVAWAAPAEPGATEFAFPAARDAWPWIATGRLPASGADLQSVESLRLGPPLEVDADALNYVALRLAARPRPASAGEHGPADEEARPLRRATLVFATDREPGLQSLSFPIVADGREHGYNVDMLGAAGWRGRILALGLKSDPGFPADLDLRWLKIAEEPQGPAQLKVLSFAVEEALPRARRPTTLAARVANAGGAPASNVTAQLQVPTAVSVRETPAARPLPATLGPGEEAVWRWEIGTRKPFAGQATLAVKAEDAESCGAVCSFEFTAPPTDRRAEYVPEPRPVRGPFEVGVYYFPGWKTAGPWHPIRSFPERRPVLGWYREGDPEVADWHIKWAVEHGITFFAYDWYWSQGTRQLEHALHDGYFRARYRHLLKFCLLWANHNAPGTSSLDDCVAVTRHWVAEYFRRPEHLRVGGQPVVIIFSPDRLTADLGPGGVKPAFEAMRAVCRDAELGGLRLVACVADAAQARQAAAEGYDAVTAYNWPGLGVPHGQLEAPFATLLPAYERNWRHILESAGIPLWVPICGGWDSRPWHGANNLVRYGRTPALFKQHVLDARRMAAISNVKSEISNILLVEAWNEFGEGSYIEPHQEFGFGYLDALREALTDAPPDHVDLTPADVGRGPYDVPEEPLAPPVWEFDRDEGGWAQTMDLADVQVAEGALTARSSGNDPAWFGPPVRVHATQFGTVVIRMRLRRPDGAPFRDRAQWFWRTDRLAEGEASSVRFEVNGDGAWHEYRVPLGQNRRWRGTITRLRLDPCNQRGVEIGLDAVRLEP